MRPNFISEEEFAEMVKGMKERGGVVGHARKSLTAPVLRHGPSASKGVDPTDRARIGEAGENPAPSPTMQSFFVPGILPGQNVILGRATRWLYRKEKKIWEEKALLAIQDAKLSPMARVHITWGWIERNKRRDPDNFTGLSKKFLLDAMVKSGVLSDDGWDEIAGWADSWHVEADNPGVRVTVREAQ